MIDLESYIGRKIKSRRCSLKLTQTTLGEKIGVTFQQIQKYEKGINKISACKLFDLATEMNIPINYFFDGFVDFSENTLNEENGTFHYEEDNKNDNDTLELIEIYRNIDNNGTKTKLLILLRSLAQDSKLI